jgi:DNA-binding transcriptional LysR family regulator
MVSRYLEGLEAWLGARLFQRTTRRLSLTDAGATALQSCRQMVALAGEAEAAARQRLDTPSGRLRITAATSFAQSHLVAALAEFLARHPACEIELITLERAVNLVEERIDLAVRISNQLDDGLVARPLGRCRSLLCASPGYLAAQGVPAEPAELSQHCCVTHSHFGRDEFKLLSQGQWHRVPVRAVLQSNDATVVQRAAACGLGIALLPSFLVSEDLRAGRLVRVLPGCEPEALGIHGVYLSRQYQPLSLRLLLDFLAERFNTDPAPWDAPA